LHAKSDTALKLRISKEIKVAVVFIVAISVLVWGIMYLKGLEIFTHKRIIYAVYDRVNGLVKANPVSISGMKVGQVKNLYFSKTLKRKIIVELYIADDYPIPRDSKATITSSGLLGSMEVTIELGTSPEIIKEGDTLRSVTEATLGEAVNQQLVPLKRKVESLISSMDTLVGTFQDLLNKDTQENLAKSIRHITESLENLSHMTANVDTLVDKERNNLAAIINNIASISSNLRQNNDKISNIFANFSSLSDSLAKARIPATFVQINKALADINTVLEKINNGQGTLGLLVNDKSLYNELDKAARDLNLLLEDIKANPKKYLKVSVF
jgi:phospholipid/cholesterol/gamma-HCH transport system substrate-binding protein